MSEESSPTVVCPRCRADIRLDESLAGPMVERARREMEQRVKERELEMERREKAARDAQLRFDDERANFDEKLAARLSAERATLIATEAKKARAALGAEIDATRAELVARNELLADREKKLTEARSKELDLLRQQRELQEARELLELEVERKLGEERVKVRDEARRAADEDHRLKMAEKDKRLADMQATVEELRRQADQGSQQLQGEVLELELEELLRRGFPTDTLVPVPKGEHGGDCLQRVVGPGGQAAGSILWETKRTKAWAHTWLPKLRDDQRAAKAEIAIIVSQALPDGIDAGSGFGQRDGVWIATPRCAIAIATCLRQLLIEVSAARTATVGQKGKMELVYEYLTSPRFGQRVHAIIESFSTMRDDLDREKRAIVKQWAKRDQQIERALGAAAGMYGDLQGIVGKSLDEIEGLDLAALDAPGDLFAAERE